MSRPLGKRLRSVMQHTCNIHKPMNIAPLVAGDIEAADMAYDPTPAYTNVVCYFEGTPEFDTRTIAGRTLAVNVLNADCWWFLQDQRIEDTWMIVMTAILEDGSRHPFYGKGWILQGNQYMIASMRGRPTDSQRLYSRQAPDAIVPGSSL